MAESLIAMLDTLTASTYVEAEIVRKPKGYKNGVPYFVYSLQRDLSSRAEALEKICSDDPQKEKARAALANRCRALSESFGLLAKAILSAQSTGGWNVAANDLYSRAIAAVGRPDGSELIRALLEDKNVNARLPIDMRYGMGLASDPAHFRLGVAIWVRNPLALVYVEKDGLAEKLGFRTGDQIVSIGNKTFSSLTEFKCALRGEMGRKLRVSIERNGKSQVIEVSVPMELPTD